MTSRVCSIGLNGMEGYLVQVEIHVSEATETMVIVGLPDASVKEAKERVLSALHTLECDVTDQKIVVNLSPAEHKKIGPLFDLAMVIGVLKERGYILVDIPQDTAFIGAISLDGKINTIDGILPALIAAKKLPINKLILPYDERIPYDLFEDKIECIIVDNAHEVISYLEGQQTFSQFTQTPLTRKKQISKNDSINFSKDFQSIIGHKQAKRALEIAAAGEHHILMTGPPGCGKSLLSETFPSILPDLSREKALEVMALYQLAKESNAFTTQPPYRNPHHSASAISIIGGGSNPKPGEISLAHQGVLFLDEMSEFTKKTLDMLRQPLESGKVTISRVQSTVTYMSKFILIGAMNPCPCGYDGSSTKMCTCTPKQLTQYKNRVSGPIYDRMDILLRLNPVNMNQNFSENESSQMIKNRVIAARKQQAARYSGDYTNSNIPLEHLLQTSPLTSDQLNFLQKKSIEQHWCNRIQTKIIRLARTISDLADSSNFTDESLIEAVKLRQVL
ncbi:YifB family Mg chelatase-like AAA ATPase [Gracilibacillus oryzae]|uniref:YifB family Mg chelatase-like AAA ATPase n=1 Tax=Gracilibacillus oryzae TaxID=1672701 RepID=A0A7C8L1C9_9BACI|nr:YifB family Mg chelatase-like AAA ATPase [Gracilibacillus oryzae]KAB8126812.1 YifB family Mg chelatase-like AAA ATPase [Gracilibacillus oryzae]